MSREYYKGFIKSLQPNESMVIGTNALGHHGGGTAGLAYRGDPSNWQNNQQYQEDLRNFQTNQYYRRTGEWAVFGQGKGFMEGRSGKSYGIVTCTRPGAKRSVPLTQIYKQLKELNLYAEQNPKMRFLSTIVGGGYSGYSFEEFGNLYTQLQKEIGIAKNIILPETLKEYVEAGEEK